MFFKTLYDTYQANLDDVGVINTKRNGTEYTLLPVAHSTQVAHIEVCINQDGEFVSADIVEGEKNTLIPVTESSSNRTANISPHPLHDKLMYVAGDYVDFTGERKKAEGYELYIHQLEKWCQSSYANDALKSVKSYLMKKNLIADLVKAKVLYVDEEGLLLSKWTGEKSDTPAIFSATTNKQGDAFIRFKVEGVEPFWRDMDFIEQYIEYGISQIVEYDFCYVLGEELPTSNLQPNKIRFTGDKAKLISVQLKQPLGYLGRFVEPNDAYSISYIASQKAHNALKWLINKQGFIVNGRVFLIWSPLNDKVEGRESQRLLFSDSPQDSALHYFEDLDELDSVYMAVLDAPIIGRLSLLQFKRFTESNYYRNLIEWQNKCHWLINYVKNGAGEYERYVGTPSINNIVSAVCDPSSSDDYVKSLTTDLLTAVVNGKELPNWLVKKAFAKVVGRHKLANWEWEKNLAITCALINHRNKGVEYAMGLDLNRTDRDYLFGRLLAVADVLERSALGSDPRPTNASRYMESFAQYPARTWKTIQLQLVPYQNKLREKGLRYQILMDEIMGKMSLEEFSPAKNVPLKETFLLGYYHQRQSLYTKKETEAVVTTVDEMNE